VMDRVYLRKKS